jgi:hypothetical protein
VTDIAAVAGCSTTQINRLAAAEGWTPRRDNPDERRAEREPSPAFAEIQAALRDPALTRTDALRLIERRRAHGLRRPGGGWAGGAHRAHPVPSRRHRQRPAGGARRRLARHDHPSRRRAGSFPGRHDLIEEIARRFEAFSEEWIDPRILAAVAATVR